MKQSISKLCVHSIQKKFNPCHDYSEPFFSNKVGKGKICMSTELLEQMNDEESFSPNFLPLASKIHFCVLESFDLIRNIFRQLLEDKELSLHFQLG